MSLRPLRTLVIGACALVGCERPSSPAPAVSLEPAALATVPSTTAPSPAPLPSTVVAFDDAPLGGPSPLFEAVVGDWYVADVAGVHGLEVDGGKWRDGVPSVSLADQAKRLYGDRYAEFLDGVKAFAFFPFAIWKGDVPAGDVRLSVRFHPLAGRVDQAAGIAFAIAPDGSYLGVRANALEDNLLFFRVVRGKRTVLDTVRAVPTPSKTWHTLALELRGARLVVELDGQRRFEKKLDQAPTGRVGLWSKADSQVLFDDFSVTALAPGAP